MLAELESNDSAEDGSSGMKGEALASIRQLLYLEIQSKQANGEIVTKKLDHNAPAQLLRSAVSESSRQGGRWSNSHRTLVKVSSLFYNLPVRRKVMRPDVEINHLKEFVQHMSVLHHNISWTLTSCDLSPPSGSNTIPATSSAKVLLRLGSQVSVAKRFLSLHGVESMLNLQEVSHSVCEFTLQGFLTPPLTECCVKSGDA